MCRRCRQRLGGTPGHLPLPRQRERAGERAATTATVGSKPASAWQRKVPLCALCLKRIDASSEARPAEAKSKVAA
jgi:hypothetical protein